MHTDINLGKKDNCPIQKKIFQIYTFIITFSG